MDLTIAEFEALLTALGDCTITSRGLTKSCEAYEAFKAAKHWRRPIDRPWRTVDRELAVRHLAHEDAAVRYAAAQLMGPLTGASIEELRPLLEATRREVHPGVVKGFVRRMGAATYRHEEVRELMMILAGHLDPRVRIEVVSWLTDARGRGVPDILTRAIKVATTDPAERVRLHALEDLGDQGDEVVLPVLERHIDRPEKSLRAYAAAVRALINMWSSPVPQPTPNKKAYERTMRLLEQTPRSADVPPWTALGGLRWVADPRFAQRAAFFELDRVHAALDAIALDPDAGWKLRKATVELLADLKVPSARFERLLASYTAREAPNKVDSQVMNLLRATLDPQAAPKPSAPAGFPMPKLANPLPSAPGP